MSESISLDVITVVAVKTLSMMAMLMQLVLESVGQAIGLKGLKRFLVYYTDMPVKPSSKWRSLSRLYPYLREHRGRLVLGFIAIIFSNAFQMMGPWVMGQAVDSLYASVTQTRLLYFASAIVGLTLLEGICRFGSRWWFIGASRDMEYRLREDVLAQLQVLPMSFYQKNKTGELMSRATNDLSNVRMMLGPGIMYTLNTIVTAVVAVGFMISIDWRLTLVSLLPMPLVSIAVRKIGFHINALTEQSQAKLGDLSSRVQESMAGVRVVKAFSQERQEIHDFREMNESLIEKNYQLIRVTSIAFPLMQSVIGLAIVIILWFGGRQVIQGGITRGQLVQFIFYLGTLAWPMIALGWVVNLLERGRASLQRIHYILDADPAVRGEELVRDLELQGDIEFHNLTFSYNGKPVLKNISLRIPRGRTVAIVGATGSGKSTLVQLIPRLYDAPPQSLFIDGVPIEKIPLDVLRRAIGFIPQDTFLFGETIRENVAFGVESASDAEVERAARISNIYDDVQQFPLGFNTIVGERGITLSGGQKQRTAISRAVIRDPRILILDDALSSVDTYTEERILHELSDVMKGRTSILISHRVSTVKDADEIVVMDRGEIVERGNHETLLAHGGYYAELHQRQLLEEELEVSE
jgi:ATP-binding cassette subfamily B protein